MPFRTCLLRSAQFERAVRFKRPGLGGHLYRPSSDTGELGVSRQVDRLPSGWRVFSGAMRVCTKG